MYTSGFHNLAGIQGWMKSDSRNSIKDYRKTRVKHSLLKNSWLSPSAVRWSSRHVDHWNNDQKPASYQVPVNFTLTMRTLLIAAALLCSAERSPSASFDARHERFTRILSTQVSDGRVDYAALKAKPDALNAYLDELAAVRESDFNRWPESERLAFLINLYNAATLQLIVDHYPIDSIKDIGGFLSGPWKQKVVRVFGKVITLEEVEHNMIRKQYGEPRIHFALVCGANGCPPLRAEAYCGDQLNDQLNDQARVFLSEPSKNRMAVEQRTIYLSRIFKWFAGDFERQSGSVLEFITPYLSETEQKALAEQQFKIRYTAYDWSLNNTSAANATTAP